MNELEHLEVAWRWRWGSHRVPLIQIVQLVTIQVNTTKWGGHPGAGKRRWDAGDGGWGYSKSRSPPSGRMNIMNVHNGYDGLQWHVLLFLFYCGPVVLCVVLFFKMFAPCDVLQIYQNVCFVTCEGSIKLINNARPTSWDSPPRPAVSSKSQLKSLNKSLSNLSLIMFWSQSLWPPVNFRWLRALCCPLHLRLLRPPQIVSPAKTWLVQRPTGRSWKAERCNIIILFHHSILHVAVYLTMSLYDIISVCTTLVANWFVILIYHLIYHVFSLLMSLFSWYCLGYIVAVSVFWLVLSICTISWMRWGDVMIL